jgi:hypothetical protein
VNGADFHAGASQNFSNGLSFRDLWLNSVNGSQLKDDGGVNHLFDSVNFNGGTIAAAFAGVRGLTMVNCASEGHTANPFTFKSTSFDIVTAVGPCQGVKASGNTFSDATPYHVVFTTIFGGRFESNMHGAMTTAAYDLSADGIAQLSISENAKVITGSARTAAPFLDTTSARASNNPIAQREMTYVATGVSSGSNTCTPATMGSTAGTSGISTSRPLLCVNADGTNPEYLTPSAVTSTTFTATFATSKAANFLVVGMG